MKVSKSHLLPLLAALGWSTVQSTQTVNNPCAAVSGLVQEFVPSEEIPGAIVPAKLAYDCLTSIPINAPRASELLSGLLVYSEFQSTLAYLKDPPSDYAFPAIDVLGELQTIAASIESGAYEREYEYAKDVFDVFQRSHDGHFRFFPDILFSAFTFQRRVTLTSLSSDGSELPKIYVLDDIIASGDKAPSPVLSIDDKDVSTFLGDELVGSYHDPDASYNALLYSHNFRFGGSGGRGQFAQTLLYPGESTIIEYENGTAAEFENVAIITGNFTGIDNAEAFYNRFCNSTGSTEAAGDGANEALTQPDMPNPFGLDPFPEPLVADEFNTVAGYFLDDDDEFADVAVLQLSTFFTDPFQHQAAVEDFFERCRESGRTKLIVDVQGNPGGIASSAFDIFGQLFPDIDPIQAENFRAHEISDALGQAITDYFNNEENLEPESITGLATAAYAELFNIRRRLTLDNESFESWDQFYGPLETYNDTFTNLYRRIFEYPDPQVPLLFTQPTGTGNRTTGFSRVFEDVVLLTDGKCASACSILANLLRERANVRSIALGGRAEDGPMGTVGGVRGTGLLPATSLNLFVDLVTANRTANERIDLSADTLALLSDVPSLRSAPTGSTLGVNSANHIRLDDDTNTPLQFVFEAADCRLFYTPEMIADGTVAWKAAARVLGNDYAGCVEASTGHVSSLTGSGNATVAITHPSAPSTGTSTGSGNGTLEDSSLTYSPESAAVVAVVAGRAAVCTLCLLSVSVILSLLV